MQKAESIRKAKESLVETSNLIGYFAKTCELGNDGYVGNVNFLKMLQAVHSSLAQVYDILEAAKSAPVSDETEVIEE